MIHKKCKCGCNYYPTIGFGGYFYKHAPNNVKESRAARMDKRKLHKQEVNPDLKMGSWYSNQRKRLTGVCQNCGKSTPIKNDRFYKWSIAHVLPKSRFHSIAKHKDGWMELCIDCHTKYDSNWLTASKMPVFKIALKKFKLLEKYISNEERIRIPNIFIDGVNIESKQVVHKRWE